MIKTTEMTEINRLEVIDNTGRILVKYLKGTEKLSFSLQDDNRTLKLFIETTNTGET